MIQYIQKEQIKIILLLATAIIFNLISCSKGCKNSKDQNTSQRTETLLDEKKKEKESFSIKVEPVGGSQLNLNTLVEAQLNNLNSNTNKFQIQDESRSGNDQKKQKAERINAKLNTINHLVRGIGFDKVKESYQQANYQKYSITEEELRKAWDQKFEFGELDSMLMLENGLMKFESDDSQTYHAHFDFCNKKIGGGVLDWGLTQEEIMFLSNFLFFLTAYIEDSSSSSNYNLGPREVGIIQKVPQFYGTTQDLVDIKPLSVSTDWKDKVRKLVKIFDGSTPGTWGDNKYFKKKTEPFTKYNIIALDAPDLRNIEDNHKKSREFKKYVKESFYTTNQNYVMDILAKLLAACGAAKVKAIQNGQKYVQIATGNFGMGVFQNNGYVMYGLQFIVALLLNAENPNSVNEPKLTLKFYIPGSTSLFQDAKSKMTATLAEMKNKQIEITANNIFSTYLKKCP